MCLSLKKSLSWGRGEEEVRTVDWIKPLGRGNGPHSGTSGGANPTKAPGGEIGRGSFSKENKDKVDQKRENERWGHSQQMSILVFTYSFKKIVEWSLEACATSGIKNQKIPMAAAVIVSTTWPLDPLATVVDSSHSWGLCHSLLPHTKTFSGTVEAGSANAQGCLDVPEVGCPQGSLQPTEARVNSEHPSFSISM